MASSSGLLLASSSNSSHSDVRLLSPPLVTNHFSLSTEDKDEEEEDAIGHEKSRRSSRTSRAKANDEDNKQQTFSNRQNNQHIREPLLAPLSRGFSSDFSQIVVNKGDHHSSRTNHLSRNGDIYDKAKTTALLDNESKNGTPKSTFSMINNTSGWATQYRRDECLLTDEIELDDGGSESDEHDLLPTLSPSASSSGVKFGLNSAGKTTRRVRRFLSTLVPCCRGHGNTNGLGNGGGWLPIGTALQRCSIM